MKVRVALLLAAAAGTLAAPAARAESRVALVIGNNDYRHARPLVNPARDASAMADALGRVGFAVATRLDADLRGMKAGLKEFVGGLDRDSVALFYFAGHGAQIKGVNYLVPVDAEMAEEYAVPDETLSLEMVLRALEQSGARLNIIVLDCCRDNPFSRSWRGSRSAGAGLAQVKESPPETLIAFATAPGSVADDGQGSNSPFTRALVDTLARPGLSLEQVFKQVGRSVSDSTGGAQRPWVNSSVYGEFAFLQGGGGMPLPPAPTPPRLERLPPAGVTPETATRERPYVNSLGMEFVPAGTPGVLFCRWETRVEDYRAYASANRGVDTEWQNPGFAQGADHPVVEVSWEDAQGFCAWLSRKEGLRYRLPTDAEWSAAVGSENYPWGDQWPPPEGAGNYHSSVQADSYANTSPVGSFQPNRFGLCDMGGNVWEWCDSYYKASMNSAEARKEYGWLNDEKASDGTPFRVLRGASWSYGDPLFMRSGYRLNGHPGGRDVDYGFRVVLVVSGR